MSEINSLQTKNKTIKSVSGQVVFFSSKAKNFQTNISSRVRHIMTQISSYSKYKELLDSLPDPVFNISKSGKVKTMNKGLLDFLKIKNENEVLGKNIIDIFISKLKVDKTLIDEMLCYFKIAARTRENIKFRSKFKNINGEDIYISIAVAPKIIKDKVVGFACTVRDVTENELLKTKLNELIITDELTGLYNRRKFVGELRREIDRSIRHSHNLSLLILDLDFFKQVNDVYGHQTGDEVLKELSRLFEAQLIRKTDIIARFGGEEFIVILPETSSEEAVIVAEKIRKGVEDYKFSFNDKLKQTVSIGVSTLSNKSPIIEKESKNDEMENKNIVNDLEDIFALLIAKADAELYKVKTTTRNNVSFIEI